MALNVLFCDYFKLDATFVKMTKTEDKLIFYSKIGWWILENIWKNLVNMWRSLKKNLCNWLQFSATYVIIWVLNYSHSQGMEHADNFKYNGKIFIDNVKALNDNGCKSM